MPPWVTASLRIGLFVPVAHQGDEDGLLDVEPVLGLVEDGRLRPVDDVRRHLFAAMGYGQQQTKDLEATIARTPCDLVLVATPIDLRRVIEIRKPALRVGYELQEIGKPDLADVLARF